jgi:hypothetical protein
MRNRVVQHIRSNVVAYVALFVALGGTSYAALKLPANSVGTRQIKNHSITPIKLDPSKTGALVRFWAVVSFVPGKGERVVASRPRARVITWDSQGDTGELSWGRPIAASCFPLASSAVGFARAQLFALPKDRSFVQFTPYTPSGQPTLGSVDIAVLCPQP